MLRRLRVFWNLPARDQRLVLKTLVGLPWLALQLKTLGFGRLRRRIESLRLGPAPFEGNRERDAVADRLTYLVDAAASNGIFRHTCLPRSLLLLRLLRQNGIEAELQVGVKGGEAFAAHAWVELDGRPLNDAADVAERFEAFPVA